MGSPSRPRAVSRSKCSRRKDANSVGFRTQSLDVRVERNPLRLVVRDLAGNIICADALGRPTEFRLGGFSVSKEMPRDEHFFGLGDKTGSFDRRSQAYTLWNTDHRYRGIDSIPSTRAFLSSSPSAADAAMASFSTTPGAPGSTSASSSRDAYSFGAEGGPLNYYLIYGPTPKQVVEGYILPHRHAAASSAVVARFPAVSLQLHARIPATGGRQSPARRQDSLRRALSRHRLPVPQPSVHRRSGHLSRISRTSSPTSASSTFNLVVITDLHIAHVANQGYMPYDTGHAGDHFVKNPDGSEFVGVVWPGPAVFPDFTRAQTREWWGNLYKQFVEDGVAGFWNDMNEPCRLRRSRLHHAAR